MGVIINPETERARDMAIRAHGEQLYGDRPYVVHLDAVANLVAEFGTQATIVAYLHDTLEDTDLPPDEIRAAFGSTVLECVQLITDPPGKNRRERKEALYQRLIEAETKSPLWPALVVKVADRLANMRQCHADNNKSLLSMYEKEQDWFRHCLHRPGLCDSLWEQFSLPPFKNET